MIETGFERPDPASPPEIRGGRGEAPGKCPFCPLISDYSANSKAWQKSEIASLSACERPRNIVAQAQKPRSAHHGEDGAELAAKIRFGAAPNDLICVTGLGAAAGSPDGLLGRDGFQ